MHPFLNVLWIKNQQPHSKSFFLFYFSFCQTFFPLHFVMVWVCAGYKGLHVLSVAQTHYNAAVAFLLPAYFPVWPPEVNWNEIDGNCLLYAWMHSIRPLVFNLVFLYSHLETSEGSMPTIFMFLKYVELGLKSVISDACVNLVACNWTCARSHTFLW